MGSPRQWIEDKHAIVNAAFTISFTANPTAQTIRELLTLYPKVKEKYPRKQESMGRKIGFNAAMLQQKDFRPDFSDMSLAGLRFDSLRADGEVERAIVLQDNSLSIMRADYTSWLETWGEVREIFVLMLPILMERAGVTAFQIQYHDRFVWEGKRGDFRTSSIFRPESPFLTPNVFTLEDLWHSYHGYFEYPIQPRAHQLLNVLESNIILPEQAGLEMEDGLVAEIKLNHRAFNGVERTGGQPSPIENVEEILNSGDDTGLLDAYMNDMHNKNKWLLARLINDEMCDKIGLNRPE